MANDTSGVDRAKIYLRRNDYGDGGGNVFGNDGNFITSMPIYCNGEIKRRIYRTPIFFPLPLVGAAARGQPQEYGQDIGLKEHFIEIRDCFLSPKIVNDFKAMWGGQHGISADGLPSEVLAASSFSDLDEPGGTSSGFTDEEIAYDIDLNAGYNSFVKEVEALEMLYQLFMQRAWAKGSPTLVWGSRDQTNDGGFSRSVFSSVQQCVIIDFDIWCVAGEQHLYTYNLMLRGIDLSIDL